MVLSPTREGQRGALWLRTAQEKAHRALGRVGWWVAVPWA